MLIFQVEKKARLCYTVKVRGDMVKIHRIWAVGLLSLLFICALTACSGTGGGSSGFVDGRNFGGIAATTPTEEETGRSAAVFSGVCYGVITDIDTSEKMITLFDLVTETEAEYGYSGGTYIMDKYGKDIAASQLSVGDIVDGGYDTGTRMLKELKKSARIWENLRVSNFSINQLDQTMRIGTSLYEYTDNLIIVSDGKLLSDVSEISSQDELIVRGQDNTIYAVEIIKGHGYVTLVNAEYFENGLVTIGSRISRKVMEDMILEVPEGEYVLEITKDGIGGRREILVQRNEETKVDVSSLRGEVREKGSLRFMIEPSDAVLYIDDEETDYSELVKLYYGSYQIRIEAENYVPYTGDLLVSENYQRREIRLGLEAGAQRETESLPDSETGTTSVVSTDTASVQQTETAPAQSTPPASTQASTAVIPTAGGPSATGPTVTEPTISAPTVTAPTVTAPTVTAPSVPRPQAEARPEGMESEVPVRVIEGYKIHVEAPVGAAVYFDGEYIGVAPVSFQKVSGDHTIIFRQNGYETKTYTVTISDSEADSHYSYPALAPN